MEAANQSSDYLQGLHTMPSNLIGARGGGEKPITTLLSFPGGLSLADADDKGKKFIS